jgi:hypothetical protein
VGKPAGEPWLPREVSKLSGGLPGKLAWYLARLRKMSASEVGWRAVDQGRKWAWLLKQARPGKPPLWPDRPSLLGGRRFSATLPLGALRQVPEGAKEEALAAARAIMSGRWRVLGAERADMAGPDWFFDPLTGRRAPQSAYCFRVKYRDEESLGNIKQIWELSRHHHITVLAAAFALSGDESYAERAAAQLRSWWEENPFLSGPNWTSGIEVGIRLISWAWARRLLDAWPGAGPLFEGNDLALRQIWWHQRYLEAFLSRGSSANNHVIAEASGQLVAALSFPWFARSERWAVQARELLEAELSKNTFPSGVNREMAFEYHGLVAELGLVAGAEADRAGQPLSDKTWELLASMLDVVAATVDEALQAPRYGDGDDGRALVVGESHAKRWESLLSVGREVFGAPSWWPATPPGLESTLLSAMAAKHPTLGRPAERPSQFPDAGLVLLRTRPGEGQEIWCRCDGGPHGFGSIAAHAHADALSIELRHGGVEVLADPGTYCYHGEPSWRRYFRSTLAHNTLELAGRDQSVPGGPFLWSRHARTRVISAETGEGAEAVSWEAEHDGYRDLVPPASHRRSVRLDRAERRLQVKDELEGGGGHPFRLAFHLGPAVEAELQGCLARLRWRGLDGSPREATLQLPEGPTWSLVRGQDGPPLGWYSPSFGVKLPTWSLIGEGICGPRTELETVVQFERP